MKNIAYKQRFNDKSLVYQKLGTHHHIQVYEKKLFVQRQIHFGFINSKLLVACLPTIHFLYQSPSPPLFRLLQFFNQSHIGHGTIYLCGFNIFMSQKLLYSSNTDSFIKQ